MRTALLTFTILAVACAPALAGKNANGAMIVHTIDAYNYSTQTVCTFGDFGEPEDCFSAVTMSTRDAGAVVWLLAAFPFNSSPGVTVIYFGIDYDQAHLDPGVAFRFCGPAGSIEVPDGDWPYGGLGNSVAFGAPVLGDPIFPFYVFKIDGGVQGAYFRSSINPTGGYAAFVDDSNPPVVDYCAEFGEVRWFENGHNDCMDGGVVGACCFPDGVCMVLMGEDCAANGGQYQGDNTICDPNPCPQPGACCFPDCSCRIMLPDECIQAGGWFMGVGVGCDPNPCECPPPLGACCFLDGHCQFVMQDECFGLGGDFMGDNIPCEPNPCGPPRGACCFDGACTITTEPDCAGQYMGDGVPCEPQTCPPTPTENTTWGQIKADYR